MARDRMLRPTGRAARTERESRLTAVIAACFGLLLACATGGADDMAGIRALGADAAPDSKWIWPGPARDADGGGAAGMGGVAADGGNPSTPAGGSWSGGTGAAAGSSGAGNAAAGGAGGGSGGAPPPGGSGGVGGSGAPPPPPPPPPPAPPELTRRTAAGRGFLVHVPSSLNPGVPAPVVFVHHGLNGSADGVRKLTRFDAIANEKGFIAVFPEGAGATWNAGVGVCGLGQFVTGLSDDFGFVQAMLASLQSTNNIDRARVFATGFSMGGYFANHIGCMRHDLVRAVAPHSGGGPPAGCAAGPLPALIIHGTADTLIWYPCGVQARDSWVAHNGCSTAVDVVPVKGGFCEYNRGCPPGGQVGLCHLDGMGHGWAGTDGTDGGGSKYENVSRVIWDFFAKQ